MSSTRGSLDISGSANVFAPDDSQLRHEVNADLTAIRYPQAGVRVELSDRAALAAVYRGEFQLSLDLTAHLQGDISGLTTALLDLQTQSVNNFLPQQVVLGGSYKVSDAVRATFDATWINWSAYVPPVAKVDVVLDIPPPPGGWPSTITPPTAPAPTRIEPLRMHDRVVPRAGLEIRAIHARKVDVFVRSGYEIAKSPIEPQTGLTTYIDRDRYTLSLGAGTTFHELVREIPGDLSFDVHLQWSELPESTTQKGPEDFVGDFRAGGRIIAFGASMTVAFDGADGTDDKREEKQKGKKR
jgi:long-chain fatty acid transport protein